MGTWCLGGWKVEISGVTGARGEDADQACLCITNLLTPLSITETFLVLDLTYAFCPACFQLAGFFSAVPDVLESSE